MANVLLDTAWIDVSDRSLTGAKIIALSSFQAGKAGHEAILLRRDQLAFVCGTDCKTKECGTRRCARRSLNQADLLVRVSSISDGSISGDGLERREREFQRIKLRPYVWIELSCGDASGSQPPAIDESGRWAVRSKDNTPVMSSQLTAIGRFRCKNSREDNLPRQQRRIGGGDLFIPICVHGNFEIKRLVEMNLFHRSFGSKDRIHQALVHGELMHFTRPLRSAADGRVINFELNHLCPVRNSDSIRVG